MIPAYFVIFPEPLMLNLLQDLRYALRQLRKSPGFALTAILTLALGIGVNSAMFTLTYAILLKSLPVPDPGRLIRYNFKKGDMDIGLSGPVYDALRKRQTASTDVLAWGGGEALITENGTPAKVSASLLSGNGFAVLELKPFLGRVFGEADDVTGGGANGYQAVLNFDYWKTHFKADPAVVGKSITLNGKAVSVIGVLPQGFQGLIAGNRSDMVLPLSFVEVVYPQKEPYRNAPGYFWLTAMGRLRPGQSVKSAEANLRAIQPQIYAEADPNGMFLHGFFKSFVLGVESSSGGRSPLRATYGQPLLILELLSGMLLLLCCTNIGLLMLARVSGRQHEFALRSALGASGSRIIGHVLLEVLSFVPPGLIAGVAIGSLLAKSLASMLGRLGETSNLDVSLNPSVLFFSCGIAFAAALAAGLWPALRVSRMAPAADIKQGSHSLSGKMKGTGSLLIPVQVAVSMTMLILALLLGASFARLYFEPSGFQGAHLTFADVDLQSAKMTPEQSSQAADEALATLKTAPGIQSAALLSMPPLRGLSTMSGRFSIDRHGVQHSDSEAWPESVSTGYFETTGNRILEGRAFASEDFSTGKSSDKVCILSRSAAEFFFPGEDPIGKLVYSDSDNPAKDAQSPDAKNASRVIGVAEDAHFFSLHKQPDRIFYAPLSQEYLGFGGFSVVVRADSAAVASTTIRNAFKRAAPNAESPLVYTYEDLLNKHLQKERMLISLSTCFAGIALVLVAVGLFGILMRSVTQRTREIGIRIALGEPRSSVVKNVLRSALKRVCIGVVIGAACAYASSRLLRALLYETSIVSPWTYAAAAILLLLIAVGASALPASRAASIQPSEALRNE